MKINLKNLTSPAQRPCTFVDGKLHSDPSALAHCLASMYVNYDKPSAYTRGFEKAQRFQRLQRLAERANKDRKRYGAFE